MAAPLTRNPESLRLGGAASSNFNYAWDNADNCPNLNTADQTDTDGDGIGDVCDNCPNFSNASQDPAACAPATDSDGDGIPDWEDTVLGITDGNADSDNDGLSDAVEVLNGTDPNNVDTDGDGLCDGSGTGCGAMAHDQDPKDGLAGKPLVATLWEVHLLLNISGTFQAGIFYGGAHIDARSAIFFFPGSGESVPTLGDHFEQFDGWLDGNLGQLDQFSIKASDPSWSVTLNDGSIVWGPGMPATTTQLFVLCGGESTNETHNMAIEFSAWSLANQVTISTSDGSVAQTWTSIVGLDGQSINGSIGDANCGSEPSSGIPGSISIDDVKFAKGQAFSVPVSIANASSSLVANTQVTGEVDFVPIRPANPTYPTGDLERKKGPKNQFVFDQSVPGTLTVNAQGPTGLSAQETSWITPRLEWKLVPPFTPATGETVPVVQWDGQTAPTGGGFQPVLTLSPLPSRNSDFGDKTVILSVADRIGAHIGAAFQPIQIFFPKTATNYPGDLSGTPNWFYYWKDALDATDAVYGGAGDGSLFGMTPALYEWSYYAYQPHGIEVIYDSVALDPDTACPYIPGDTDQTGIDVFSATIIHERKHRNQVDRADALVLPLDTENGGETMWRYGWAWNQGGDHNHWTLGDDDNAGIRNIDDDHNGCIDDLPPSPHSALCSGGTPNPSVAFELGSTGSDDLDLNTSSSNTGISKDWPSSWPLPCSEGACCNDIALEHEAILAEPRINNDPALTSIDWSSPGKQFENGNPY